MRRNGAKSWLDFWNGDTAIYACDRHRELHYEGVARDLSAHVPSPDSLVLDYGCGEALFAARLARECSRLLLYDAAPLVREKLRARFRERGAHRDFGGRDAGRRDRRLARSRRRQFADPISGARRIFAPARSLARQAEDRRAAAAGRHPDAALQSAERRRRLVAVRLARRLSRRGVGEPRAAVSFGLPAATQGAGIFPLWRGGIGGAAATARLQRQPLVAQCRPQPGPSVLCRASGR